MKSRLFTPVVLLYALALITALAYAGIVTNEVFSSLFSGYGTAVAQETGAAKVVFTVE